MSGKAIDKGLLVVISGPSGVGKTTVMDRLLCKPGFDRAVTATTRRPRGKEVDGVDYVFLTVSEFEKRIEAGEFVEHAEVHGNLYGTPRRHVEEILGRGEVCLLGIDVQGAAQLRGRVERALFLFLLPPDDDELARRLSGRKTEDPATVARRLEVARAELARVDEYDVSVVNDRVDRAVDEIQAVIETRRGKEQES